MSALPPHLRTMFRVEDADGSLVAEGYDLGRCAASGAAAARRARVADVRARAERPDGAGRSDASAHVEAEGVTAYPALADEAARASACASWRRRARQSAVALGGTRRLILSARRRGSLGDGAARQRGAARAGRDAGSARRRGRRGGRRADRRGRRAGVGRGGLRAPARVRGRLARRADASRSSATSSPCSTRRASAAEARRLVVGRAAAGAARRRASARRPRLPRLRGGDGRGAAAGPRAPTCRRRRGGSTGCRRRSPRTATAWPSSTTRGRVPAPRRDALPIAARGAPGCLEELRVSQFAQGLGVRGASPPSGIARAQRGQRDRHHGAAVVRAATAPPCASTIRSTIARPSPAPAAAPSTVAGDERLEGAVRARRARSPGRRRRRSRRPDRPRRGRRPRPTTRVAHGVVDEVVKTRSSPAASRPRRRARRR